MIRRPPRSTQSRSSAASDVYKRQPFLCTSRLGNGFRVISHQDNGVGRNHVKLMHLVAVRTKNSQVCHVVVRMVIVEMRHLEYLPNVKSAVCTTDESKRFVMSERKSARTVSPREAGSCCCHFAYPLHRRSALQTISSVSATAPGPDDRRPTLYSYLSTIWKSSTPKILLFLSPCSPERMCTICLLYTS